jgi:hypothetical protein
VTFLCVGRPDARSPRVAQNVDPTDLARIAVNQDTRGADRSIAGKRKEMDRCVVQPVDFVRFTHALFVNEHGAAQRLAQRKVTGDLDPHHAK